MQYQVIQQHFGDKQYWTGETRTVENKHDAETLINMGLIAPLDEKAEKTPKNKNGKQPKNKAEPENIETAEEVAEDIETAEEAEIDNKAE